jgi:hypothetical protein
MTDQQSMINKIKEYLDEHLDKTKFSMDLLENDPAPSHGVFVIRETRTNLKVCIMFPDMENFAILKCADVSDPWVYLEYDDPKSFNLENVLKAVNFAGDVFSVENLHKAAKNSISLKRV